jgi:hypothetical protein
MEYSPLSALPWGQVLFLVGVGAYALTLVRLRRHSVRLEDEVANVRKRIADLKSA